MEVEATSRERAVCRRRRRPSPSPLLLSVDGVASRQTLTPPQCRRPEAAWMPLPAPPASSAGGAFFVGGYTAPAPTVDLTTSGPTLESCSTALDRQPRRD